MSDDLEVRLRAAFRDARLPPAPVDLLDCLDGIVELAPAPVGRGRLLAVTAAVAAAVVVALTGLVLAPRSLPGPAAVPVDAPARTVEPTVEASIEAATLRPGWPTLPRDTIVGVDATTGALVAAVPARPAPGLLTIAGGHIWTFNFGDGSASRLDPERRTLETVELDGGGASILGVGDEVWAAAGGHDLVRLDGATGRLLGSLALSDDALFRTRDAGFMAVADGSLWLTVPNLTLSSAPQQLWQIDPETGETRARIDIARDPQPLLAADGAVFIVSPPANTLTRVDAVTGDTTTVRVGDRPVWIAAGGGSIWVAHELDRSVWRLDPSRLDVTARIPVSEPVRGVTWGGGRAWVTTSTSLLEIDPAANEVVTTTRIVDGAGRGEPTAPVLLDGVLWFAIE